MAKTDKIEKTVQAAGENALDKALAAQGRLAELMQQKKQLTAEIEEARSDWQRHTKAVDEALGKGSRGRRKKKDNPNQTALPIAAGPAQELASEYQEEHPGEANAAPVNETAADAFD